MKFKTMKTAVLIGFALVSIDIFAQIDCSQIPAANTFYSLDEAMKDPSKVVKLDLGMQTPKLKAVPKEVGIFLNLECLDVSYNRVASIPDEIKYCRKLKSLILTGNHYLTKLPPILKEVTTLKVLDVSGIPGWSAAKRKEAKDMLPKVNVVTD
jgi:hypothetical protein